MIEFSSDNLLDSSAQALINPVNCVGVMGAGLARAFAKQYPEMFEDYKTACQGGKLSVGKLHAFQLSDGRWIVNFPTKQHWRNPSERQWIIDGLLSLIDFCVREDIDSLALPALGCGLGGLSWQEVEAVLLRFANSQHIKTRRVTIYPPQ